MSTVGGFSKKNPTIKRILKEASELANSPSPDYHAEPLESDLFEWHFTLRGPPAPSHYAGGIYHGRISLPPTYPLRPPSFKFTTATGRFEVNREICLSISGHHEETWQPAWGIRTALVAIRSFMDTNASGQVGGIDTDVSVKQRLAKQSVQARCATCGKTNGDIMKEREEAVKSMAEGQDSTKTEEVPDELRLAYREDLAEGQTSSSQASSQPQQSPVPAGSVDASTAAVRSQAAPPLTSAPVPARSRHSAAPINPAPPTTTQRIVQVDNEPLPWIDKAIYGVAFALIIMILRQFS